MLNAYSYYEPEEEGRVQKSIKKSNYFEKELKYAEIFAKAHPSKDMLEICPICGKAKEKFFYKKWKVDYFRCNNCFSIAANISPDDLEEYRNNQEIIAHRKDNDYQAEGNSFRMTSWIETLDWIKFRSFRYLKRNKNLSIVDYGNRWSGYIDLINSSDLCGEYELRDSILKFETAHNISDGKADLVFALDYLQQIFDVEDLFKGVYKTLKDKGLFIFSFRAGSGIDIISLKENNRNVFPYEHIMLPSRKGIEELLNKTGFRMLEYTTPGTFDFNYIKENRRGLSEDNILLNYILDTATPSVEAEFQRFIQKAGISSYAQVIACKGDIR